LSAHYHAYWLNELYFRNFERALEYLEQAAKIWPEEDEIYWLMCRTYRLDLRDPERAEACRRADKRSSRAMPKRCAARATTTGGWPGATGCWRSTRKPCRSVGSP